MSSASSLTSEEGISVIGAMARALCSHPASPFGYGGQAPPPPVAYGEAAFALVLALAAVYLVQPGSPTKGDITRRSPQPVVWDRNRLRSNNYDMSVYLVDYMLDIHSYIATMTFVWSLGLPEQTSYEQSHRNRPGHDELGRGGHGRWGAHRHRESGRRTHHAVR